MSFGQRTGSRIRLRSPCPIRPSLTLAKRLKFKSLPLRQLWSSVNYSFVIRAWNQIPLSARFRSSVRRAGDKLKAMEAHPPERVNPPEKERLDGLSQFVRRRAVLWAISIPPRAAVLT